MICARCARTKIGQRSRSKPSSTRKDASFAIAFHRVMMRSVAKLAYDQAQAAMDGAPDDTTRPLLGEVIAPLYAAYGALKMARAERQPLDLDLPERKLFLKPDGTLDRVVVPPRLEAHRLIEELMILANVCAAETLERAHIPLLYRVHDEPSAEKLEGLREVLASIGIKLPKQGAMRPGLFNTILKRVEGHAASGLHQRSGAPHSGPGRIRA